MKTIFTCSKKVLKILILLTCTIAPFNFGALAQTKHIVEVTNNKFTPDELNIVAGDTVEWRNLQGYHNVNGNKDTYPENPESFGNNPGNGWIYSHIFTIPGKYDYQCNPHVGLGMVGKIEVKDASGNDDEDKYILTINFTGMNPHDEQNLYFRIYEKNSGKEVERKIEDISPDFNVTISGIEKNHSYYIDFFADHNQNGKYDTPPTDHAWRLELNDVMGDTTLNFAHNTNFTDIMWQNRLTVHFTGMNPHVGQDLWLAVTDKNSGMEVDRVKTKAEVEFMVHVYGIENGMSYNVDFFADHNQNGMYDAPPTDHAWRLELNDVMGDTTLNFAHNTNFTDIMWQNRLTVHFTGMNPHAGQYFWVGLVDQESGNLTDSIETTASIDFMVHFYGIENGMSYHIDFYADHNGNGMYDAPPTDHAWRLELNNIMGDSTLNFAHNTNFTDIFETTSISKTGLNRMKIYPNPAFDIVSIEVSEQNLSNYTLSVYDISGKIVHIESIHSNNKLKFSVSHLKRGIYFVELKNNTQVETMKLIKK